jgi:hypothetical protein
MVDDTHDLILRIQALTREEVMEAALAFGDALDTGEELEGEAGRFVEAVEQAPLKHIEETEELARVLLLVAAGDEELAPTVRRILDGVGGKAFILGGLEIVALASLAVAALHIVISKGRTREKTTTTFKYGPDGKIIEGVVTKEQTFGISPNIGGIVTAVAGSVQRAL